MFRHFLENKQISYKFFSFKLFYDFVKKVLTLSVVAKDEAEIVGTISDIMNAPYELVFSMNGQETRLKITYMNPEHFAFNENKRCVSDSWLVEYNDGRTKVVFSTNPNY